jgi:hypothetical protein
MISSPNIFGPRTSIAASRTTSIRDAADAVLDHDHRAVDHEAEINRPEAHQAGGDAHRPHEIRGEQHRQRDRQRHDEPGPDVAQEHEQHRDHQQPALGEVVEHGVEGAGDQVGAVVEDLELHPGGQRPPHLLELVLGGRHDAAAVLAADHHHHPGDRLAAAVACGRALPGKGADPDRAHVADQHRHPAGGTPHDHPLDVGDVAEQGLAADEPLFAVADDVAAPGACVVPLEGAEHLGQRDAVR